MVGNPETDRLPVAGSIFEWPVIRSESHSVQLSAPSHSARAQVTIYDLELLYQSKTRRAGCSNGLR